MASKLTNGTAWSGSATQTTKSKKYTFSTKEKYLTKDIELTVNADIVLTVGQSPLQSKLPLSIIVVMENTTYGGKNGLRGNFNCE